MPARRRQNRCFSHLATELIPEPVFAGKLRQPERGDEAAAFGEAEIEEIAGVPLHSAPRVDQRAERFVQHDRNATPRRISRAAFQSLLVSCSPWATLSSAKCTSWPDDMARSPQRTASAP